MATNPMRQRRMVWTEEENERLRAMASKGVSMLRAAAALKCSTEAIRVQARKLGTPFPTLRQAKKRLASKMAAAMATEIRRSL